ncbi:MAG: FAD:protein FMN transferase [Lachnospiraceae bacterium]|nr:FAD:protein FMN transferase [Lachnospiraceae bacterium]
MKKNCLHKRSIIIITAVTILTVLSLCSCARKNEPYSRTGIFFDTIVDISIYDDIPKEESDRIISKCFDLMAHYEGLFSRTVEDSDISRINRANGNAVTVSPETIELLTEAIGYAKLSSGIVDPTVGRLSILWNIGSSEENRIPSEEEIENALSTVDYTGVILENDTVRLLNPEAALDLGFIAKGYIADRLKEYMLSEKIGSAVINLGGNVLLIGSKNGNDFEIGLKDPLDPNGRPRTVLGESDVSIVSSGNYERFFEKDGKRYHHILSLSDGYPAESDLSMVTIVSKKSIDGDALSTLCFILGSQKAKEFLSEHRPDVYAVFTDMNGNVTYSR